LKINFSTDINAYPYCPKYSIADTKKKACCHCNPKIGAETKECVENDSAIRNRYKFMRYI
jgi:hypothetical protein